MAAPELPRAAAELAVPSIGRTGFTDQEELWPGLTLPHADVPAAARIARAILTDPLHAADVAASARDRLAALRTPVPAAAIA
jgi:hypothetical protein